MKRPVGQSRAAGNVCIGCREAAGSRGVEPDTGIFPCALGSGLVSSLGQRTDGHDATRANTNSVYLHSCLYQQKLRGQAQCLPCPWGLVHGLAQRMSSE